MGLGKQVKVLGHNFGTDQLVWKHLVPHLVNIYCVVLYDNRDAGYEHEDLDQLFEGVRSSYKATVHRVCSAGGRWHGLGGGARIQSNLV
ncbi:hypothetical protein NC652_018946 [Populus alba x Populus x berolinensis]|nr:hypothetical protein NC652_018946 [Populus alba x Populus x berolinensis]